MRLTYHQVGPTYYMPKNIDPNRHTCTIYFSLFELPKLGDQVNLGESKYGTIIAIGEIQAPYGNASNLCRTAEVEYK